MIAVCIGGSHDGERQEVYDGQTVCRVQVLDLTGLDDRVETYYLEPWRSGSLTRWLLRHDTLTRESMLDRLIDGYHPGHRGAHGE